MKPLAFLALIALVLPGTVMVASVAYPLPAYPLSTASFFTVALADDDEEDEEDEDEDEDEDDDREEKATKPKTIKVVKEVIEYRPVTETVIVTEAAYAVDTDSDALVDAIDPDPLVPQSEYFTDTDNDGVPNALDRYHDEDDFSYYEFETDDDGNGILDSYE
jgi:hypothetical protein